MPSLSVSERSVQVEGIRLHVRESGDGPPVLLINGIGAHVGMWAPMERYLPGMRMIAFDAPGTGRSATSPFPLSLELLSRLTERLLDRLGYDQVDVLGYSFGGLIAQYLARRAPTRVRRLVLAATTPGWGGVPGSLWTLSQMATPLRYYWRPYYEAVIGQLMGGRARNDAEFVHRHGATRQLRPPTALGYAWQLLALAAGPGSLAWLGEVTTETLVLAGDDDPVMPLPNALLLARYIPTARLFVARGEGHLLLMDDRSSVLPIIQSFLTTPSVEKSRAWRESVAVDDNALRSALGSSGAWRENPAALMSACVRAFTSPSMPDAETAS
jgi:pimeloyl-ACP methyl ester carboxylesterase